MEKPEKNFKITTTFIVWGLLGIWFIYVIASNANTQHPPEKPNQHVENAEPNPAQLSNINAHDLFAAYRANEVAADIALKGKRMAFTGVVQSIDKDIFDNIVIRIQTINKYTPISANLLKSQESPAAALQIGVMVQMTCTGGGMLVGRPQLNDCVIAN
jgi:hypothetical protein